MKWLRRLLAFALLTAALFVAAAFALDAWIESSGGRQVVERTLSDAVGLPVRLGGDFDVHLLPPGASGTDFIVMDETASVVNLRSRAYDLALELRPLLRREFRVDSLRLEWLVLGEPGAAQFALPSVEVSGFAIGQPTDIDVELGWLGSVAAVASWHPEDSRVAFELAWSAQERDDIELQGSLEYAPEGVYLPGLTLSAEGQRVWGSACFLTAAGPVLALDLEAGALDLDALEKVMPGGQGGSMPLPFDLALRLRADTLLRGSVEASGALLEVGPAPNCSRPTAR